MIYQDWSHHIDSWSVPNVLNTENCNNEQDSLQPIYYIVDLLKYDIFHINMMKRRQRGLSTIQTKASCVRHTYQMANVLSKVFLMFVHFRLSWLTRAFNMTNWFMELTWSKGENCKERRKTMLFPSVSLFMVWQMNVRVVGGFTLSLSNTAPQEEN